MNIKEAVDQGYKYFSAKTSFGTSYLELIEVITIVKVKNLSTGNNLNVEEDRVVKPLDKKPYIEEVSTAMNSNFSKGKPAKVKKINQGPNLQEVLIENINKIKSKGDLKKVLKNNGIQIGSSTIRYAWFKRNQILKNKGGI